MRQRLIFPADFAPEDEGFVGTFPDLPEAITQGERIYRGRCVGCHRTGGGAGPSIFKTRLRLSQFLATVTKGRKGTSMPSFEQLLSRDEIWQVHAFLMSRDSL